MITLKPKTDQEAFDMVVKHLKSMPERSMKPANIRGLGMRCAYRSRDGLACAIGCMVSDEDARTMDAQPESGIDDLVFAEVVDPGEVSRSLLSQLQDAHDDPDNWDDSGFIGWGYLVRVADDHGLEASL
jgi:hypothetical protein